MAAKPFHNFTLADRSLEAVGGVLDIPFQVYLAKIGTDWGYTPGTSPHIDARRWVVDSQLRQEAVETGATELGDYLYCPVPQLRSGRIVSITVQGRGAGGHAALPAGQPGIAIRAHEPFAGSGAAYMSAANVAAYQANHSWTLSLTSGADLWRFSLNRFTLEIQGEVGPNALPGYVFRRIYATIKAEG